MDITHPTQVRQTILVLYLRLPVHKLLVGITLMAITYQTLMGTTTTVNITHLRTKQTLNTKECRPI